MFEIAGGILIAVIIMLALAALVRGIDLRFQANDLLPAMKSVGWVERFFGLSDNVENILARIDYGERILVSRLWIGFGVVALGLVACSWLLWG
jgi:hypothetical protein